MGTEHYLVDDASMCVLDLHKSSWTEPLHGRTGLTLDEILEAFDNGDAARRCHQPRLRVVVTQWMDQRGSVRLLMDSYDDMPFEDDRGEILSEWTGFSAFTWPGMVADGWTPWLGHPITKETT